MWGSKPVQLPVTAFGQLRLVPVRNAAVRIVTDEPERLILTVAMVYPRWLGPLPRWAGTATERRFELEGLGLWAWRRIDDRTTLEDLIDALVKDQQLGFHEARMLILAYLRNLSVKNLVILGDRTLE